MHLVGRWSPPVGHPHIFPAFAGIAEVLPLFLSFCVSVSRHREGRPDTSSVRREVSKVYGMNEEEQYTHRVLDPGGNERPIR